MKKRREEKRGYPIIISKCTVKWSIIRAVQAKPGFLKKWIEFQIRGKTWVPCFGKTWVPRFILMISVLVMVEQVFTPKMIKNGGMSFSFRAHIEYSITRTTKVRTESGRSNIIQLKVNLH